MKAFVLAGGFATRLWPLTEKRAKPLLPLAGIPMLTHLVEKIPEGIPVTVSTNAVFADAFHEWSNASIHQSINILIEDSGHEDEKLGALGAVAKWITEEKIEEDVLLLAGDNYVGFSLSDFIGKFTGSPLLAAYDIGDKEQAKKFGTVIAESGSSNQELGILKVTGFEEKPPNPQSTLVSTGCYVLPAQTLPALVSYAKEHPDNIGGIFEHLLTTGTSVHCASYAEPWFDIGSFEAYLEATRSLVGENVIEQNANLKETECKGSIVLGQGSRVTRSSLTNVVLFEDCEVEDCVLENCVVDNGCTLRGVELSGKMLREGTKLIR